MQRIQSDPGPLSSPQNGVERALKRADHGLYLVYKRFYMDPTYREAMRLAKTGAPIYYPRWHVFLEDGHGRQHHLFAWEEADGTYATPDKRIVQKILGDLGRSGKTPEEVNRAIENSAAEAKARKEKKVEDLRTQTLVANKSKVGEILEGDNINKPAPLRVRDPKIASYGGQGASRGTRNDTIQLTDKELGWEKPDYEKEMRDA